MHMDFKDVPDLKWTAFLFFGLMMSASLMAQDSPRKGWVFRSRDILIGAWSPPKTTETEYRSYKEAGFNVVMTPRYESPELALDLSKRFGLLAMVDTYAPNDKPWGGQADAYTPQPVHHPATPSELRWLHDRCKDSRALTGYLLANEVGALPPEAGDTTRWLRDNASFLYPWVCQNVLDANSLVSKGNPIACLRIIPSQAILPAWQQALAFSEALQNLGSACLQSDLIPWSLFDVSTVQSDSLLRFQVYASLAYGAQGLWELSYRGPGGLLNVPESQGPLEDDKGLLPCLTPNWYVAKRTHAMVQAWSRTLVGRRPTQIFHTGSWRPSVASRIDSVIDFNWGESAPTPSIPRDEFKVTWTGTVSSPKSETVTFYTLSDDGVKLNVNHQDIINNWTEHGMMEDTGKVSMEAGVRVPFRLEFFDKVGPALIQLFWSSPSHPEKSIVPSSWFWLENAGTAQGLKATYGSLSGKEEWQPNLAPGAGLLIVDMSEDLMVGILSKTLEPDLAMVVDKRVDSQSDALPPREVEIHFSDQVRSLILFDSFRGQSIRGQDAKFTLKAGDGQLILLRTEGWKDEDSTL